MSKTLRCHSFVSLHSVCVIRTWMVYNFFAHGRLNNVWTRLNDVVISISQAQIETEVHWNSCLSFAGRLEQDFCWPSCRFLSYNFWSVFVTCRTQLEALCKQARRFTASTGIATLACLKPRQLQYLLRERKTPEEDIAKSETRKLQESRRPEGMQKFFVTFRICPCCLHSTSGCFKQPCTRCQTVKTGVWQCQDGHLGCYTFFIQIIENASSSLYRAWHFTSSFMLLEVTVGKAQEERRRMLSGLTATVSNNVKSMNTNMTQANQNKHLVYFVWTCQSEDCENMQWAHETV